jgi:hypothetical protein
MCVCVHVCTLCVGGWGQRKSQTQASVWFFLGGLLLLIISLGFFGIGHRRPKNMSLSL